MNPAASPTPHGTDAPTRPAHEINPMIDSLGGPYPVIAVLSYLSRMFNNVNPDDSIELDRQDFGGASLILETCIAALEEMDKGRKA